MHLCRRDAETVGVFTQQHLDQLIGCGFQHVENVVFYGSSATLPFVRQAPRRAPPVQSPVATDDADIVEPQEVRASPGLPSFVTMGDVIATMEGPFQLNNVIYSPLIKWGDDAKKRRNAWTASGCASTSLASNETMYRQRLQIYWAFHHDAKWVEFDRDEKLPSPLALIYQEATRHSDAPPKKNSTWMAAALAIVQSKPPKTS
jgi:hypothetical protein